jgi:hypothetical protein
MDASHATEELFDLVKVGQRAGPFGAGDEPRTIGELVEHVAATGQRCAERDPTLRDALVVVTMEV